MLCRSFIGTRRDTPFSSPIFLLLGAPIESHCQIKKHEFASLDVGLFTAHIVNDTWCQKWPEGSTTSSKATRRNGSPDTNALDRRYRKTLGAIQAEVGAMPGCDNAER